MASVQFSFVPLVIAVGAALSAVGGEECGMVADMLKFDCYPEGGVTADKCYERACCFEPPVDAGKPTEGLVNETSGSVKMGVPMCYYGPEWGGYLLSNVTEALNGMEGTLALARPGGPYGNDVDELKVVIYYESENYVHFKIFDPSTHRYEVPIDTPPPATRYFNARKYNVSVTNPTFSIQVKRNDGTTVFDTDVSRMIFEDQFLQIASKLPSPYIYGLGEHVTPLQLDIDYQLITLMTRDRGAPYNQSLNLYGFHPFYLNVEESGRANGVLFLNSNPMDIVLQPAPAITYRAIGGIMDFYVFLGPTPSEVISQYLDVIGHPYMPPYWSLGFHLCHYGYNSSEATAEVVNNMRKFGIPQDVQWNDIDYMRDYLDFTVDPVRYGTLPALVDDLHQHGQHYVMITDPGISSVQPAGTYLPYEDGIEMDVFIKNSTGQNLIGSVWPGLTTFPDFSHPNATAYWTKQVARFHSQLPFDGLWTDMNEVSNFVDGSTEGCPDNNLDYPPYKPSNGGEVLHKKTMCMSAKTYSSTQYNMHNMYGYFEMIATMGALKTVRKQRSLVISRSTFPGSGKHGGHWLGDNKSKWMDLYLSIPGILNFNMFGIPLVGADICGFGGVTTPELCTRWTQLGAFYPFSRNHAALVSPAQDPTQFEEPERDAMRKVLLIRYSLLPTLYTLFWQAHTKGMTVARPLFFEFPQDRSTLAIDKQFLWGSFLLISPTLVEGATSVQAYFPQGVWYDFYTGEMFRSSGVVRTLPSPLDTINVHLRGGHIIVRQAPEITTALSRQNNFTVTVAVSINGSASGILYLDDGVSLESYENGQYSVVNYTLKAGALTSANSQHAEYTPAGGKWVEKVIVYGVSTYPESMDIDGTPVHRYIYDNGNQVLTILLQSHNVLVNSPYTIRWV